MSSVALRMDGVYKKFQRGERHDSLRDLLPALVKRAMRLQRDPHALRKEEFWALQDVTFEVAQGEAVGFIGHNGAGKSTLLKLLSGIIAPTLGTLQVNGRLSALIEVGAGFHPDLTGRENIFLNGVILGMPREHIRRRFDEIVAFAGIEDFVDTPVKRYSSGMYARLGFSIAAHLEPDILVIDEVLSVGDFLFQQKSLEKMRSVLKSGATVLFVSHNLRAMSELCPRAILLHHGKVMDDGPTSNVLATYIDLIRRGQADVADREVVIESAMVFGEDGPRLDFASGERAWFEVTFRAVRDVRDVSCTVYIVDEGEQLVFLASSAALGERPVSMQAGERRRCVFELTLHLPAGKFQLCAKVCGRDGVTPIDSIRPAAELLMRSEIPVQGVANLYPRLAELPRGATSVRNERRVATPAGQD
jgi:ABC-type polysaccharide/polyol phosphate transport system ATPase subunit